MVNMYIYIYMVNMYIYIYVHMYIYIWFVYLGAPKTVKPNRREMRALRRPRRQPPKAAVQKFPPHATVLSGRALPKAAKAPEVS